MEASPKKQREREKKKNPELKKQPTASTWNKQEREKGGERPVRTSVSLERGIGERGR